jgi:hypothetical protein
MTGRGAITTDSADTKRTVRNLYEQLSVNEFRSSDGMDMIEVIKTSKVIKTRVRTLGLHN